LGIGKSVCLFSILIFSIGLTQSALAQVTSCPPDYVIVNDECVYAFDEEPGSSPFTIQTDKASYDDGDTVRISGMIETLNENFNQAVTILTLDPNEEVVSIVQTFPDTSGMYSTSFVASSEGTMTVTGEYEVRAQYGAQKTSTTFSFTSSQFLQPIVVATDKLAYNDEDTILIFGEVKDLFSGVPVSIQIISPIGNAVTIIQLDVAADKTFNTQVTAGGAEWGSQGIYIIIATYGAGVNPKTAETTFFYTPSIR